MHNVHSVCVCVWKPTCGNLSSLLPLSVLLLPTLILTLIEQPLEPHPHHCLALPLGDGEKERGREREGEGERGRERGKERESVRVCVPVQSTCSSVMYCTTRH